MIWYVPLEPLEERYTKQMFKWVIDGFTRKNVPYHVIFGKPLGDHISTGEVLDAEGTNHYKASQLQKICRLFRDGKISNGDIFFVADLWFPGIEMIRYIEAQKGMNVTIAGVHYAGIFDPNDFVQKMGDWVRYSETGWLTLADMVFVGSEYHKDLIVSGTGLSNIYAFGLVWDAADIKSDVIEKQMKIIFPHRLDQEKNPQSFFNIAKWIHQYRDPTIEFVITSSRKELASNIPDLVIPDFIEVIVGLTKQRYYDELASSKIFFSSAYQETFGYAFNEALALGCIPICPNRLSYVEVLEGDERLLYNTFKEAKSKLVHALYLDYDVRHYTMKYSRNFDCMLEMMLNYRRDSN